MMVRAFKEDGQSQLTIGSNPGFPDQRFRSGGRRRTRSGSIFPTAVYKAGQPGHEVTLLTCATNYFHE